MTDGDAAGSWSGWRLDEIGGSSVGRVAGLYVDAESDEAVWLSARLGLFGGRALVPVADAVGAAGHVWVPYGRVLIKAASLTGSAAELTREQELELCAHFGIPDGIGRAAAVERRAPGAVTARAYAQASPASSRQSSTRSRTP